MFSVNPSTPTDPSFYPRCGTDRESDRDQGSRSIIAKLHFLRVCCSIAASYHLPLHLSPSDGLHIEVGLAPPIQKLLHAVDMLCIDYYYEACQRKKRANTKGRSPLYHATQDPRPKARGGTRLAEALLSCFYSNAALLCFRSDSSCSRRFAIELSAGLSCDELRPWICSRGMRSL